MERRLAAILVADVVGYSRLMEQDEAGTMAALAERRKAVWGPLLAKHRGRVIRTKGDGTLAEFVSAVDAVQCAVDLQRAMKEANTDVPDDRAIVLRIGLNLGDVMVEDGDLYGDGVNVAARLEAMADPDGICLSAAIYQQVERLLPFAFRDLGDQALKNIARPVRVYSIVGTGEMRDMSRYAAPTVRTVAATNKPSIAVLPFTNITGDPEQQYFSDGIADDIITELSRFRSLFVIARNSSFQYRDKAVDVRRVARELGVQYVMEGSIRRSGKHLRMTAQLIDGETGNHVWAERYDRSLEDLFAIQDEVVQAIVGRITSQLTIFESEKARRRRTGHLGAYDCYLRGLDLWRSNGTDASIKTAEWFEKAIELDPEYAEPLAHLSVTLAAQALYSDSPDRFERALAMANKAVALDPKNSWSHCALGVAKLISGFVAASASHFETAMQLNPNDSDQIMWCLTYHMYSGDFDSAREMIATAERLNPIPPAWYRVAKAMTAYGVRDYAAAADLLENLGRDIDFWDRCYLAACYVRLERLPEAKLAIAEARRLKPSLTIKRLAIAEPYTKAADIEHLLEPLRKAGLPE